MVYLKKIWKKIKKKENIIVYKLVDERITLTKTIQI